MTNDDRPAPAATPALDPLDPEGANAAAAARVSNWGRWGDDGAAACCRVASSRKSNVPWTSEEHNLGMIAGWGLTVLQEWYQAPTFYFTNPVSLVGAHDDVPVPRGCERFGYTIFNDWSARDLQAREMVVGLGPAKGNDFITTLGPWLVTADELGSARDVGGFLDLDLQVDVNGTLTGHDPLASMAWPFEELASYASRGTVLRPGDVLAPGTCGNGGCLAELWGRRGRLDPPPLTVGDVVEMTVERIGTVRSTVVAGPSLPPVRRARSRVAVRGGAA